MLVPPVVRLRLGQKTRKQALRWQGIFSTNIVFMGQRPVRTSFSYLICLENKKQTASQRKKVRIVLCRGYSPPGWPGQCSRGTRRRRPFCAGRGRSCDAPELVNHSLHAVPEGYLGQTFP